MTANRVNAMKASMEHADRQSSLGLQKEELKEKKRQNRKQNAIGFMNAGASIGNAVGRLGSAAAAFNHPEWYMKVPGAEVVANVNAYKLGGVPYKIPYGFGDSVETVDFIVPQIFVMKYRPTIGETTRLLANATAAHSPHVLAPAISSDFTHIAQELFAFLRKSNGGSLNGLDPNDMLEALLAFSEGFGVLAHLKRLYRLVNTWEKGERALPAYLIQALYDVQSGYTAQQQLAYWSANKLTLLGIINTLVKRLNTLTLPRDFAYAMRRMYVNENIFVEHENCVNNKYYAYVPTGYLYWTDEPKEIGVSSGTITEVAVLLEHQQFDLSTVDKVQDLIHNVVDPLFDSTDLALVCSYFLNAYKDSASAKLYYSDPVGIDEVLNFNMDEHFGDQIRNTKCYGDIAIGKVGVEAGTTQFCIIEQLRTGRIFQNKRLDRTDSVSGATSSLLNVEHAKKLGYLDQEEVFEYTRGMCTVGSLITSGERHDYIIMCGTEYVEACIIWGLDSTGAFVNQFINTTSPNMTVGVAQFRYAPCWFGTIGSSFAVTTGTNSKLFTYTVLSEEQLRQIHKIANYSVFSVDEAKKR